MDAVHGKQTQKHIPNLKKKMVEFFTGKTDWEVLSKQTLVMQSSPKEEVKPDKPHTIKRIIKNSHWDQCP